MDALTWWDMAPTMELEAGVPVRFIYEAPSGRRTRGVMLTPEGVAIAPAETGQPRLFRTLLDAGFRSRVLPDYETAAGLAFVLRRWFALEVDPEMLRAPLGAVSPTQREMRNIRDRNDCGCATDADRYFAARTMSVYTTRHDEAAALKCQAWGARGGETEPALPVVVSEVVSLKVGGVELLAGKGGEE